MHSIFGAAIGGGVVGKLFQRPLIASSALAGAALLVHVVVDKLLEKKSKEVKEFCNNVLDLALPFSYYKIARHFRKTSRRYGLDFCLQGTVVCYSVSKIIWQLFSFKESQKASDRPNLKSMFLSTLTAGTLEFLMRPIKSATKIQQNPKIRQSFFLAISIFQAGLSFLCPTLKSQDILHHVCVIGFLDSCKEDTLFLPHSLNRVLWSAYRVLRVLNC